MFRQNNFAYGGDFLRFVKVCDTLVNNVKYYCFIYMKSYIIGTVRINEHMEEWRAMLRTLIYINIFVGIIMTVAYFYQIVYAIVGLIGKRRSNADPAPAKLHKFAAVICARNEEAVIGELVASLKAQNYPAELLDIFVLADNCTDSTAQVSREAGAIVYERYNTQKVGKGFALDHLFKQIALYHKHSGYEGYFVFDADNIVDVNFVTEMNKTFDRGYNVITCYRNSKNFGMNWISASYSIWFLREARFLNSPRMLLGTSCAVSGTGFLVASKLVEQNGGWPFHMLTEDIQFSVNCALTGTKIGYCDKAIIYDEQPLTFRQSWMQRLRWSKGFYQVDARYALPLLSGAVSKKGSRMSCFDMFMTVAPGMLLTLFTVAFNIMILVACITQPTYLALRIIRSSLGFIASAALSFYIGLFAYGTLTVASEWKQINEKPLRKIMYLGLFPIFMATYIPISIAALGKKVEWKPIRHFSSSTIQMAADGKRN